MRGGQACDFMDEELIAKACATVDQKEGDETLSILESSLQPRKNDRMVNLHMILAEAL